MVKEEVRYLRLSGQNEAAELVEGKLSNDGVQSAYYLMQADMMREIMRNNLKAQIEEVGGFKNYYRSLNVVISYGPMKWVIQRLATSCYMLP